MQPWEGRVGDLYCRVIGQGQPIVILHGGPDFDHTYLLPELDVLAESFQLVYYDQRARGRSTGDPSSVTLESELEDIESIRRHFELESVAVLGHSWGGLLALEYATRHADRVSHLILLNTAPAATADADALGEHLRRLRTPQERERLQALVSDPRYEAGDLEADAEFHRIHFRPTVGSSELLDVLVGRLRQHFTPDGVRSARAIEDRLHEETWGSPGYDLIPALQQLRIPALVLHGAHDFIPVAVAERIADALPRARFVVLANCGHFATLELPDDVRAHVAALFGS